VSTDSGFFGFIDIFKGLPVRPKIIMFVGTVLLIIGFTSGPFSLHRNAKISAGVAVMLSSLSWRDWEFSLWQDPSPPYKTHWDAGHVFWAIVFGVLAVWMFRICYLTPAG